MRSSKMGYAEWMRLVNAKPSADVNGVVKKENTWLYPSDWNQADLRN